jgi:hypothetical protein
MRYACVAMIYAGASCCTVTALSECAGAGVVNKRALRRLIYYARHRQFKTLRNLSLTCAVVGNALLYHLQLHDNVELLGAVPHSQVSCLSLLCVMLLRFSIVVLLNHWCTSTTLVTLDAQQCALLKLYYTLRL